MRPGPQTRLENQAHGVRATGKCPCRGHCALDSISSRSIEPSQRIEAREARIAFDTRYASPARGAMVRQKARRRDRSPFHVGEVVLAPTHFAL
jgi:hypothetical protein